MIEVRYRGGFGNQLFQYCFGRILAQELGWELQAAPIEHFPATREAVSGQKMSAQGSRVLEAQETWQAILQDPGSSKIILHGFFQKYANYKPYKETIRSHWLKPRLADDAFDFEDGDLAVHIRRGDYVQMGMALPLFYYRDAIQKVSPRRVILFSDDLCDSFHDGLNDFRPIRVEANPWSTFSSLLLSPAMVMSQSTFSWWAAFLGNQKRVIAPVPYFGYWSDPYFDIDLTVDDEQRYEYLPCRKSMGDSLWLQWFRLRENYIRFRRGSSLTRGLAD